MVQGLFVVIEGIDCSGKSSIAKKLGEKLSLELQKLRSSENNSNTMKNNLSVTNIQFPDRSTATGNILNNHLRGIDILTPKTSHLIFSANRWEKKSKILELRRSNILICDRYYHSGIAYTNAQGVDLDWCIVPDKGLPVPDILFFLDIKPQKTKSRKGFGTEIYEYENFQNKVYAILKKITLDDNGILIDGNLELDEISEQMKNIVLSSLEK